MERSEPRVMIDARSSIVALLAFCLMPSAALAEPWPSRVCTNGAVTLAVGYYAFFAPVSYSADPGPGGSRVQRASRL